MFKLAFQRPIVARSAALRAIRFQSNVAPLNSLQDFQKAVSNKSLSVIDFYATWCGPCKAMAPHFEKLSDKYPDVDFYRVDVDGAPDVAGYCGVSAMPTFLLAKESQTVGKIVGADVRGLTQAIEDLKN
ncbi:LANO_0A01068g1_1 [Lachancea nothofagi CBS 11611]|uniref:LANO_0A01068g1_1 n=1 Tax=Lachancea nothofagi CBS 11611 TaxID=1266666 RepID=A0A1G4IM63_9SACH|nr:LANO_0A01068g1_1 [Lachancea nothofagi CBS 11611]